MARLQINGGDLHPDQGVSEVAPSQVGEVITLSRRQVIAQLSKELPLNDFNLPTYLYRTDVIPPDILNRSKSEREQVLTAAMIQINYDEGYPAFESGHPIWERLEFESSDAHTLFSHYLKLVQNGIRQIHMIESSIPGLDPDALVDYFHMHYWKFRAKAFDLFLIAMHEKKRLMRLMQCEDDHYVIADGLLRKCQEFFDIVEWKDLDPGVVARMIPQLATLQRQAVGAATAARGGGASSPGSEGAKSVEVILRQLTEGEHQEETIQTGESKSIATLLKDPEAAKAAQELIVKLNAS